ncbi:hypothetical protein ACOMHN_015422 [Nucella lapillus]
MEAWTQTSSCGCKKRQKSAPGRSTQQQQQQQQQQVPDPHQTLQEPLLSPNGEFIFHRSGFSTSVSSSPTPARRPTSASLADSAPGSPPQDPRRDNATTHHDAGVEVSAHDLAQAERMVVESCVPLVSDALITQQRRTCWRTRHGGTVYPQNQEKLTLPGFPPSFIARDYFNPWSSPSSHPNLHAGDHAGLSSPDPFRKTLPQTPVQAHRVLLGPRSLTEPGASLSRTREGQRGEKKCAASRDHQGSKRHNWSGLDTKWEVAVYDHQDSGHPRGLERKWGTSGVPGGVGGHILKMLGATSYDRGWGADSQYLGRPCDACTHRLCQRWEKNSQLTGYEKTYQDHKSGMFIVDVKKLRGPTIEEERIRYPTIKVTTPRQSLPRLATMQHMLKDPEFRKQTQDTFTWSVEPVQLPQVTQQEEDKPIPIGIKPEDKKERKPKKSFMIKAPVRIKTTTVSDKRGAVEVEAMSGMGKQKRSLRRRLGSLSTSMDAGQEEESGQGSEDHRRQVSDRRPFSSKKQTVDEREKSRAGAARKSVVPQEFPFEEKYRKKPAVKKATDAPGTVSEKELVGVKLDTEITTKDDLAVQRFSLDVSSNVSSADSMFTEAGFIKKLGEVDLEMEEEIEKQSDVLAQQLVGKKAEAGEKETGGVPSHEKQAEEDLIRRINVDVPSIFKNDVPSIFKKDVPSIFKKDAQILGKTYVGSDIDVAEEIQKLITTDVSPGTDISVQLNELLKRDVKLDTAIGDQLRMLLRHHAPLEEVRRLYNKEVMQDVKAIRHYWTAPDLDTEMREIRRRSGLPVVGGMLTPDSSVEPATRKTSLELEGRVRHKLHPTGKTSTSLKPFEERSISMTIDTRVVLPMQVENKEIRVGEKEDFKARGEISPGPSPHRRRESKTPFYRRQVCGPLIIRNYFRTPDQDEAESPSEGGKPASGKSARPQLPAQSHLVSYHLRHSDAPVHAVTGSASETKSIAETDQDVQTRMADAMVSLGSQRPTPLSDFLLASEEKRADGKAEAVGKPEAVGRAESARKAETVRKVEIASGIFITQPALPAHGQSKESLPEDPFLIYGKFIEGFGKKGELRAPSPDARLQLGAAFAQRVEEEPVPKELVTLPVIATTETEKPQKVRGQPQGLSVMLKNIAELKKKRLPADLSARAVHGKGFGRSATQQVSPRGSRAQNLKDSCHETVHAEMKKAKTLDALWEDGMPKVLSPLQVRKRRIPSSHLLKWAPEGRQNLKPCEWILTSGADDAGTVDMPPMEGISGRVLTGPRRPVSGEYPRRGCGFVCPEKSPWGFLPDVHFRPPLPPTHADDLSGLLEWKKECEVSDHIVISQAKQKLAAAVAEQGSFAENTSSVKIVYTSESTELKSESQGEYYYVPREMQPTEMEKTESGEEHGVTSTEQLKELESESLEDKGETSAEQLAKSQAEPEDESGSRELRPESEARYILAPAVPLADIAEYQRKTGQPADKTPAFTLKGVGMGTPQLPPCRALAAPLPTPVGDQQENVDGPAAPHTSPQEGHHPNAALYRDEYSPWRPEYTRAEDGVSDEGLEPSWSPHKRLKVTPSVGCVRSLRLTGDRLSSLYLHDAGHMQPNAGQGEGGPPALCARLSREDRRLTSALKGKSWSLRKPACFYVGSPYPQHRFFARDKRSMATLDVTEAEVDSWNRLRQHHKKTRTTTSVSPKRPLPSVSDPSAHPTIPTLREKPPALSGGKAPPKVKDRAGGQGEAGAHVMIIRQDMLPHVRKGRQLLRSHEMRDSALEGCSRLLADILDYEIPGIKGTQNYTGLLDAPEGDAVENSPTV